ncbi:MAG: TonB-dependent receptor [Azospirillaceae bacterium]|nr:TonB-dependent receptor [Azospirillaceae bacterium]
MTMKSKDMLATSLSAFAILVATSASTGAFAQTASTQAPAPAAPAATPATTASTDSDGLEEIVVTARKTAERLQDVPLAVAAMSSEQLESHGITDLQGLARFTPGFQFKDFVTAFHGDMNLRGLSQANVQNAVGNVGAFIDGVYMQRGYMASSTLGDWERIEVIKGPQSALYGSNTFSGAINYIPKEPGDKLGGEALVSYGSDDTRRFTAAVGGPIIDNVLSARIFVGREDSNGTWKNNLPGASGDTANFGAYKRDAVSGLVNFTPTDTIKISAFYKEDNRTEYLRPYYEVSGTFSEDKLNCGPSNSMFCGTLPTNPSALLSGVGNRPEGLFAASEPPTEIKTKVYRISADWDITPDLTLHYIYGQARGQAQEDLSFAPNTYNPTGGGVISQQHEGGVLNSTSHELRLAWDDGGPFKADIGGMHSSARDQFLFGIRLVSPGATLTRLSDNPLNPSGLIVYNDYDTMYDTDAVFARASYSFLGDKAKISLEGRYSDNSIDFNDILSRTKNPALPLLTSDYKDFIPRATAEYHLTPDTMLYASAAKGVKAGGFNGYTASTTTLTKGEQSFGEESNWTYEAGAKNTFLHDTLTVNADFFYITWANKQSAVVPSNYHSTTVNLGTTPPSIYENTGNATSYGIEVNGMYRPIHPLTFNYGLAWTHARYDAGSVAVNYIGLCDNIICKADGSIGGKQIEGSPSITANLGGEWRQPLRGDWDWFAGVDETWQNKMYADAENLVSIDGFFLTDARLGVDNDRWKIWLWGKNIFDKQYISSSFIIPSLRQYAPSYGDRASYGITASVKF